MNSVIFTAGVVLVWLSSLFNGTGLGNAYHTDRITTAALIGLTVILLLRRRQRTVPKDVFIAFGGTVCIFAMSGILHGTLFADLYRQPDQGSGARHAVIRPCGVGVGNGDPRDL